MDLCLFDLMLENRDGISLMESVHAITPDVPTIILTAHGAVFETAVEAMRKGAYGLCSQAVRTAGYLADRTGAGAPPAGGDGDQTAQGWLEERFDFANIVARSAKMRSVLDIVDGIAKLDSTVHVQGEGGSGKELIAKAIPRRER